MRFSYHAEHINSAQAHVRSGRKVVFSIVCKAEHAQYNLTVADTLLLPKFSSYD